MRGATKGMEDSNNGTVSGGQEASAMVDTRHEGQFHNF